MDAQLEGQSAKTTVDVHVDQDRDVDGIGNALAIQVSQNRDDFSARQISQSARNIEEILQPTVGNHVECHLNIKDSAMDCHIERSGSERLISEDDFNVSNAQVKEMFDRNVLSSTDLVPVQIAPEEIDETITNKVVQSLQRDYVLDLPFSPQPSNVLNSYSTSGLVLPPGVAQFTQNSGLLNVTSSDSPHTSSFADNVLATGNDGDIQTDSPKATPGVYFEGPQNNAGAGDQIDDVCAAVGINQNSSLVDFFSSLELQSRWVGDIPRAQAADGDDRLDHQRALRIASILNDLAFNSDTEDFLPSDADDLWTSDLDDPEVDLSYPSTPSKSKGSAPHHPGKWRPGQSPVGKKRGKSMPNSTGQQSQGKLRPSGKLNAMRKAKAEKPSVKSRGKRMSAKLKAMKKARLPDPSENDIKWRPGERLRDRRNFRKVWLEGKESAAKRGKKAKPYHSDCEAAKRVSEPVKLSAEQSPMKRRIRDAREDLPPEMRGEEGSEEEEEVVPLDFICRTCEIKLYSQGHFIRHIKSQDHIRRTAKKEKGGDKSNSSSSQLQKSNITLSHTRGGEKSVQESRDQNITSGRLPCNLATSEKSVVRLEVAKSRTSSVGNYADRDERQVQAAVESLEQQLKSSSTERPVEDPKKTSKGQEVECTICTKTFLNKYQFARHLATNSHLHRASVCPREMLLDESVQVLLLRQSRVQCLVCSFFATSREFLLQHMSTREHVERTERLIGPLLCVRCKFVCRNNEEMLSHVKEESHSQLVEASGRPCIVKESRTKIPCPSCLAIVQSATRLKIHLKSCTGNPCDRRKREEKREPVCSYCEKRFSTLYAMTIHIRRRHTKEKPFRCDWCDVAFADRHSLGVHQLSITHLEHTAIILPPLVESNCGENNPQEKSKKGKRYKCRHCPFTAKIYSALRPHYYAHHSSDHQFRCEDCDEKFSNDNEQKKHNKSSKHRKMVKARTNKFECSECGKVCKDEKSFKFHELSHSHPLSEKQLAKEQPAGIVAGISSKHLEFIESIKSLPPVQKVKCPECSKWMPISRIYTHLRRHEGVKLFQCPYCPKNLASANTLRQHIHAHLQVKNHQCNKCDRSFLSHTLLKEHLNEKHSPAPEALAVCKQCGEKFPSARSLYKHQLTHISAFKCTFQGCFYTTKYKYDLKVHMKTHSSEKEFLCNLCGYASKRKGGLVEHMKSHTGHRRFTCEYCDYRAKTGAHLRRHMRIHIGAKPFSCPYCTFKCASLDNLHKHIYSTKKHTGLPVYPCKLCDYGSNSSRDFRNHLVGVHKIDDGDIGKMLSSYCGIYDKSSDPKDIPEGACALPVREIRYKAASDNINHINNIDNISRIQVESTNDYRTQLPISSNRTTQIISGSEIYSSSEEQLIETSQCGDDNNEESSLVLTMLPQEEIQEDSEEIEDDAQVFPDIQALLRHLTQGGTATSVAETGHDLDIQGQVEIS